MASECAKKAWSVNREPMNKNCMEGAAEQLFVFPAADSPEATPPAICRGFMKNSQSSDALENRADGVGVPDRRGGRRVTQPAVGKLRLVSIGSGRARRMNEKST